MAVAREATVVFDYYVQDLAPSVFSPRVLGPTASIVLGATVVAGQVTARHALRVDPLEALRAE